jgi:hypothetical protein
MSPAKHPPDFRSCRDPQCERFPCQVWKEAHAEGYRDGYQDGYGDGYAAGVAASRGK